VTTPLVRERGFDLIAHRDDPPQRPRRWEVERRQFTGCEVSTTFIAVSVFTPWAVPLVPIALTEVAVLATSIYRHRAADHPIPGGRWPARHPGPADRARAPARRSAL
jgi:hypothetical protein